MISLSILTKLIVNKLGYGAAEAQRVAELMLVDDFPKNGIRTVGQALEFLDYVNGLRRKQAAVPVHVGDRVRVKRTGDTAKVVRVISVAEGIVLNRPLTIIRLDRSQDPDISLTTAFVDELEVVEAVSSRATA